MSIGPDVLQMAIGSEGTLGIVTDVVVRLRPKPEVQVGKINAYRDLVSK